MAKVVVAKSIGKGRGDLRRKDTGVAEKRVKDDSGKVSRLRTLDGKSETFSTDLTYVFRKNVELAREENRRIVGVSDFVPAQR